MSSLAGSPVPSEYGSAPPHVDAEQREHHDDEQRARAASDGEAARAAAPILDLPRVEPCARSELHGLVTCAPGRTRDSAFAATPLRRRRAGARPAVAPLCAGWPARPAEPASPRRVVRVAPASLARGPTARIVAVKRAAVRFPTEGSEAMPSVFARRRAEGSERVETAVQRRGVPHDPPHRPHRRPRCRRRPPRPGRRRRRPGAAGRQVRRDVDLHELHVPVVQLPRPPGGAAVLRPGVEHRGRGVRPHRAGRDRDQHDAHRRRREGRPARAVEAAQPAAHHRGRRGRARPGLQRQALERRLRDLDRRPGRGPHAQLLPRDRRAQQQAQGLRDGRPPRGPRPDRVPARARRRAPARLRAGDREPHRRQT